MTPRTFVVSSPVTVDRLASFLKAHLEHPLTVLVERQRNKRTLSANARLWKLHTLASDATGYSPEELHEECLGEFFGWQDGVLFGKPKRRPKRTTTTPDVLPTQEFAKFMTYVETLYGEQLGVWLEGP
jgi:hypothetical protein